MVVDSWGQAKVSKYHVSVLLPQPWRLGVALHCGEDRDDVAVRDGGSAFVLRPPLIEGPIGSDIEALLRRWGFCKGVTYVRPVDEEVLSGGIGLKQTGTGLINAVCIDFVENHNKAGAA
jgi:hypothetical protein